MPKRKLTRSGDTPRRYKKKPRKHHIVNQTVAQVQSKQVVEKNNMAFPVSPLVNRGRGVSTPTSKVGNQKQADLFNKAMATAHIKPKNKPSQTPVLTSVPQSLRRNDVGVQGKGPAVHEQMSIRVPSSLLNSNCPISALPSSVIESLVQGATPNQPRVVTIIRMGSGGSVGSRETVTLTPQVTNASSSKIIVASSGKNANTISTVKGQIMGTSSPSQVVSKVDMQDTGCHKDALSPTKHKKHKTQYDTARTQTTRTLDQGRRSSNRVRILTYKAAEAEDSRRVNTQTKSSGPRKPNLGSENLLTVNDDLAQSSDKTVTASDREIEIICDEFSTKSSNPDLAHISRTKSTSQKFGDDENTFMHTKSTDHLAVEELQIREDHDNTVLAGAREEKQTVRADEGVQESPREDRRQLTSVGIQVDDSDMFPWQQVSLETDQGGVDLMRPQAVESSSSSSTVPPLKALLTEALEKKSKRPTAYTLYCNVHRAKLVAENPGIDLSDFSQISRRLGQMWQTLTKKEKWCWRRKAKRLVTLLSTGKGNKPKLSAIPTVGPAASTAPAAPAAPNLPASKPMMLHQGARIAKATVKESTLSPIMKYNDDMKGRPKHSTSVHRSSVATTVVTSATVARDVNEDTLSTIVEKCVTVPQQFVGHIIMPSYPINVLTQSQAIAMETKEKDFALAESLSSDIKLEPEVSVDETGTESKAILENQTMPKLESNGSSIEVNARVKIEPEVSSDETGTESKTFLENQNIPNLESNDSSIDVDAKIKIEPEVSSDEIGTEQKVILEGQNIPRLELINPSIDMEPEVYIDRDDVDGQVIERDKDADGQVYIERDNDTDGQVIERDKDADGQVYIDRDKDADGQVYIERDNDADSKTVDDRESTNRINLKRRKVKRRCSASPMRKKKTTLDEEKLNKDLSGLHSQRDENSADVSRYQNAERNQDTDYKECEEEGDDDSVDEDMSKRKQGTNKRELHDAKTLREESWFGCIHCPMAFRTLNNYYKHVKKHPTYNKKRDNLFWIKNRDQWKVSTCTACGIHYPDKEGLKAHCKRKGCPTFKKMGKKVRGSYRSDYSQEDFLKAVNLAVKTDISVRQAAARFGIPHTTLRDCVQKRINLLKKTKKTRKYKSDYSQDDLDKAYHLVVKSDIPIKHAASQFGIPNSSLRDYVRRRINLDNNLIQNDCRRVIQKPKTVRRSYRSNYSQDDLDKAYHLVVKSDIAVKQVASQFGIPISTLKHHVRESGLFPPIFTQEEDAVLSRHIKTMTEIGYGYTQCEMLNLVTDYAIHLGQQDRIHCLSNCWLNRFMDRNPGLEIQMRRKLKSDGAKCATREAVSNYFHELEKIMDKYSFQYSPQLIFIIDEKVLSTAVVNGKAETVTMIGAVSASWKALPPYFVFPGQCMQDELMEGSLAGAQGTVTDSGSSNTEVFSNYIKNHFINFIPERNTESPVLVLYDGHKSHVSLGLIEWAADNNIVLFVLPPRTNGLLQPLDGSFYGPFQSGWIAACRQNGGKVITLYDVCRLACQVHSSTLISENIASTFRRSGIYPLNAGIVPAKCLPPSSAFSKSHASLKSDDLTSASSFRHLVVIEESGTAVSCRTSLSQLKETI